MVVTFSHVRQGSWQINMDHKTQAMTRITDTYDLYHRIEKLFFSGVWLQQLQPAETKLH